MLIVRDTLPQQLAVDFARACSNLAHARLMLQLKDTPVRRAAVAEQVRTVDVLLDMFLQADASPAGERHALPAPAMRV